MKDPIGQVSQGAETLRRTEEGLWMLSFFRQDFVELRYRFAMSLRFLEKSALEVGQPGGAVARVSKTMRHIVGTELMNVICFSSI